MAKVVKVNREPRFKTLTLEISYEEAEALGAVFERVGGDPAFTRRDQIDAVCKALRTELPYQRAKDCEGTIHFLRS